VPLPAEPPAYRDLSGWIVLKILEAIKRGEIKSGERLVERDIAARLAVSRAPVRDAIHRLETLGVVKRAFPRGVEVRSWTERDSAEVFLLFDALILLSVQLSAGRLQPDDIVQLERILQETHENKERASPDFAHQFALDVQFHLVIARASGHGRLVEMMQSLVLPLELWPKSFEAHKHPSFQLRQHSRLLEALKTGNRDIAIECVMSNIREGEEQKIADLLATPAAATLPDDANPVVAVEAGLGEPPRGYLAPTVEWAARSTPPVPVDRDPDAS
jgi:DNA-binding GntR family transcriptional regulator